jgi:hypothetical protein
MSDNKQAEVAGNSFKYTNQVILIIVTFLVTLILNAGVELLKSNNAEIKLSTVQVDDSLSITSIRVENYSGKEIDNLEVSVPATVSNESIVASADVHIIRNEGALSTSSKSLLTISRIQPRMVTQLLIDHNPESPCCLILNATSLGVRVVSDDKAANSTYEAIKQALFLSIFYTFIVGVGLFWMKNRILDIKADAEELSLKLKKNGEAVDSLERNFRRFKLTLLRRMLQYAQELRFWRDTIRKALTLGHSVSKEQSDELLQAISMTLQTYETHDKISVDIDDVEQLIDIIKREGKQDNLI